MNQIDNNYPFNLVRDIYGDRLNDNSHTNTVYLKGLFNVINELDENQQQLIKLRYQELGSRRWCGEQLGITTEQARQLEARTLRKLRNPRSTQQFEGARLAKVKRLQYDNNELSKENSVLIKILKGVASGDILPDDLLITENTIVTIDINHKKMSSISIDNIDLSVRAYNCLRRAGHFTLGDIEDLTEKELSMIRNIGKHTLTEIKDILKEHGLSLRPEPTESDKPETEELTVQDVQDFKDGHYNGHKLDIILDNQ